MSLGDVAGAVNKTIQQILLERELQRLGVSPAQLAQRNQARQDAELGLRQQELQMRGQEVQSQHERQARQDQATEDQRTATNDRATAEMIPGGRILSLSEPAAGSAYRLGLANVNTTLPSRQMTGAGPGSLITTNQASDNVPQSLTKLATEKQQESALSAEDRRQGIEDRRTAAEQASADRRMTADIAGRNETRSEAAQQETARHNRVMENKPAAAGLITIQTVDDQGNPVTRIVPKVAGSEFKKPASATVENRLASAQAVQQTGNDIITQLSRPDVAAKLGPAMGRYNTLRDFIGNPPPELAELAGSIESFALANMGVHGMRSVEGAKQISALLDRRHTPESLAATIRGLNNFSQHFIENEGRGGRQIATPAPAPPTGTGTSFKVIGVR